MNYINKFNWNMALIALLFIEDNYTMELLGLENINSVKIKFAFNTAQYNNYGSNPVVDFIKSIDSENIIDLVTLKFNEKILGEQEKEKSINLFNFLYIAYMPKDKKIITDIEVQFNNITTSLLSEGQKKLILVQFITKLLADNKSLVLFDEPDSHLHVSRKKELANIIKNSYQYCILTTHSPALINFLDDNSVRLLRPSISSGVKCEEANKFTHIEAITDNFISLLDTSLIISTHKHILMCEGVNDLNYIKKALEVLNRTHDNKYKALENIVMINCGGADNVVPVFEEIVLNYLKESQICICLFDYDEQGKTNKTKIESLTSAKPNIIASYHPCIDTSIDQTNDPDKNTKFLMENYFSISSYRDKIISSFESKNDFKSLSEYQSPKSIISKNYKRFIDEDFNNFNILFNKLLELFELEES